MITLRYSLFLISVGKKTHDFMKWVSEIIKVEADAVLKIKEFAIVNDCFQYKSNLPAGRQAKKLVFSGAH